MHRIPFAVIILTLAALGVMFGVAVVVSEWRLSRVEERPASAEAEITERDDPFLPAFFAPEPTRTYSPEELDDWNCVDAWGALTDEQADRTYGQVRQRLGTAPVPQAILDLIDKYCD
ncbi:MAG: hypothetical protein WD904_14335 [Dehalococcoidia bacterium]